MTLLIRIIMGLAVLVCAAGLYITWKTVRRQEQQDMDQGVSQTRVKHPILANPIFYAYVLFPILVLIGAVVILNFM
ncbi:hypothetical protein NV379_24200 [Paenibacillus sp. N1-5-1-14]|uniref:hypothetical protein n=1 Tax=Paenibacillus radicibacter TaxID=2972488 RepID=UPI002158A8FB|nr:hypothetical protein [Paenibacillus radicibacter]MCR8645747.1 hypothetical protein [Paenibacillus radicibacter]